MANFEKKEREPLLSEEMQLLIDRTHRKNITDKYDNIDMYKFLIMKMLLDDQDVLRTLHNEKLAANTRQVPDLDKDGNQKTDSNGNHRGDTSP